MATAILSSNCVKVAKVANLTAILTCNPKVILNKRTSKLQGGGDNTPFISFSIFRLHIPQWRLMIAVARDCLLVLSPMVCTIHSIM
jgi:hypothetical protein